MLSGVRHSPLVTDPNLCSAPALLFTFAPRLTSNWTMRRCPLALAVISAFSSPGTTRSIAAPAAMISAFPFPLTDRFGSAPRSSRSCTTGSWPFRAAPISGLPSPRIAEFTLAPARSNCSTLPRRLRIAHGRWPSRAKNAVLRHHNHGSNRQCDQPSGNNRAHAGEKADGSTPLAGIKER